MKALNNLVLWFLLFVMSASALMAQSAASQPSQSNSNTSGSPKEDKSLIESQKDREQAEAEYYRAQTEKIRNPPPNKSLWQNITENPASALGVLGALVIASVTLISFALNYRAALHNQMDTQFYEALKRFGDKDSAATRASAAAMIAQMTETSRRRFNLRHPLRSLRKVNHVYFETSRQQLVTGFLLEENEVALFTIRDALLSIMRVNPSETVSMIFLADQKLRTDYLKSLVEFFCALGAERFDQIGKELWDQAEAVTISTSVILRHLMTKKLDTVTDLFAQNSFAYKLIAESERGNHVLDVQGRLGRVFFRLKLLVTLYSFAFTAHRFSTLSQPIAITMRPLMLVFGELQGADLSEADLRGAYMYAADLQDTNLTKARLAGAWMARANLRDAKLSGSRVDNNTDLTDANWWAADFFDPSAGTLDSELFEWLYRRYAEGIPSDRDQLHPSVNSLIDNLKGPQDESLKK